MSNRAYKKYLKRQEEKKKVQKVAAENKDKEKIEWLEKMLAAYLHETKIPSSQACLMREETVLPKNIFAIMLRDEAAETCVPIKLVLQEADAKKECADLNNPSYGLYYYEKIVQEGPIRETKYWFEHHEKRAKLADTHPDVQYLFNLSHEICRANHQSDAEAVKEGIEAMTEFMQKYHDLTDKEVSDLAGNAKK